MLESPGNVLDLRQSTFWKINLLKTSIHFLRNEKLYSILSASFPLAGASFKLVLT